MQATAQFPIHSLLARLPAPPCRLLALGIGLEPVLPILDQHGYRVQHIVPDGRPATDPQQPAEADTLSNARSRENLETPTGRFDGLLVAHHIEPLTVFNLAIDRLPLSGDIVIMDRFVPIHDEYSSDHLLSIKDVIALGERLGFEWVECVDVMENAVPFNGRFASGVSLQDNRHGDIDPADSQPPVCKKNDLIHHDKNTSPVFALIRFRKKAMTKWRINLLKKAQIDDMRDLFKRTFQHEMTHAFWEWKYGSGSARAIGVWENNQLIAHYGGMARKILYFGQPQTAVQIGDVMVDSTKRGILVKKGPIFLMMATFLERYIGYGKPYFIGYGFPNDRHMKVAELLGLYAEVGHMVEYSWPPCSRFPLWGTRLQMLQQTPTDSEKIAIDSCWRRMATDLQGAVIGIRDWRYLEHRYLGHPHNRYQILLIRNRFSGKARGIFVLSLAPEGCELVDAIAPLSEIPLLITHARRLAGMQGASRVFCRITANFAHHFDIGRGIRQSINIRIPTNIWSAGPSPEVIRNHWWLMSGDMDFR